MLFDEIKAIGDAILGKSVLDTCSCTKDCGRYICGDSGETFRCTASFDCNTYFECTTKFVCNQGENFCASTNSCSPSYSVT